MLRIRAGKARPAPDWRHLSWTRRCTHAARPARGESRSRRSQSSETPVLPLRRWAANRKIRPLPARICRPIGQETVLRDSGRAPPIQIAQRSQSGEEGDQTRAQQQKNRSEASIVPLSRPLSLVLIASKDTPTNPSKRTRDAQATRPPLRRA